LAWLEALEPLKGEAAVRECVVDGHSICKSNHSECTSLKLVGKGPKPDTAVGLLLTPNRIGDRSAAKLEREIGPLTKDLFSKVGRRLQCLRIVPVTRRGTWLS
jgi:hypothetical protein